MSGDRLIEEALQAIYRASGGRLLEDEYPTRYLPNVGRQVMQDGGMPDFPFLDADRVYTPEEEAIRNAPYITPTQKMDVMETYLGDVADQRLHRELPSQTATDPDVQSYLQSFAPPQTGAGLEKPTAPELPPGEYGRQKLDRIINNLVSPSILEGLSAARRAITSGADTGLPPGEFGRQRLDTILNNLVTPALRGSQATMGAEDIRGGTAFPDRQGVQPAPTDYKFGPARPAAPAADVALVVPEPAPAPAPVQTPAPAPISTTMNAPSTVPAPVPPAAAPAVRKPYGNFTDADVEALANMIAGEASTQGREGMAQVGQVAINRALMNYNNYGDTLQAQLSRPKQFLGYNSRNANQIMSGQTPQQRAVAEQAREIARGLLEGTVQARYADATDFNKASADFNRRRGAANTQRLGAHTFFNASPAYAKRLERARRARLAQSEGRADGGIVEDALDIVRGAAPELPMSEGDRNAQLNDAVAYADRLSRAERIRDAGKALSETRPVQMVKSIAGGLALPGDVAAGRVDPTSEVGIQRAADLAGTVMGGSFAGRRPAGSIGMGGREDVTTTTQPSVQQALDVVRAPSSRSFRSPSQPVDATLGVPTENVMFRGKDPADWTPQDWHDFGKQYGVPNLGPKNQKQWQKDLVPYTTASGREITFPPGGYSSPEPFTYYDLLHLKSQGINPNDLPPEVHQGIHNRMVRSMQPGPEGPTNEQITNQMIFGLISPNQPLTPNELALQRAMVKGPRDVEAWEKMIPYRYSDTVPPIGERQVLSREITPRLGLHAAERGGIGASGSANYTDIAEFVQKMKDKPEFYRFNPNDPSMAGMSDSEKWATHVGRVMNATRGLKAKTGSLASVWQSPETAAISAIDRHMATKFRGDMFPSAEAKAAWEANVVAKYNEARPEAAVRNIDEMLAAPGGRGHFVDNALAYVNNLPAAMTRVARTGEYNPSIPAGLRNLDWPGGEPRKMEMVAGPYVRALEANAEEARRAGQGLFSNQWMLWDRIRNRLEPHEILFPGLEKLPRMSLDQMRRVTRDLSDAGYMAAEGGVRPLPSASRAGYFTIPPVLAGGAALLSPEESAAIEASTPVERRSGGSVKDRAMMIAKELGSSPREPVKS